MIRDPLEDYERPEVAVFTETDVAALVEEMRAKCEAIARAYAEAALQDKGDYALGSEDMAIEIADAVAALRRPDNR